MLICPNCNFRFQTLATNQERIPSLVSILCESCGQISLLDNYKIRKATNEELELIKESPAFKNVLGPMQEYFLKRRN